MSTLPASGRRPKPSATTGRVVEIRCGSRLHFGMFSFGQAGLPQFGGVGAMVDAPALRLRIAPANSLTVIGPQTTRTAAYADTWFRQRGPGLPACRIETVECPAAHIGLGSGTQLGLAVAAGLDAFYGCPRRPIEQLAGSVGRGARSAIGLHGFAAGGLLVESGKWSADQIAPLVARAELPAEWRWLLLRAGTEEGLSGERERSAFARLPPVPQETTGRMCQRTMLELLPAAHVGDFARFGEALFRLGQDAGSCFAALQGGLYAGDHVAELVQSLRELGIRGVGQSSWGPTVFALLPTAAAADRLLVRLERSGPPGVTQSAILARPLNRGAEIAVGEV